MNYLYIFTFACSIVIIYDLGKMFAWNNNDDFHHIFVISVGIEVLKQQFTTLEATRFRIIFKLIFMVYGHVKDRLTHMSFAVAIQGMNDNTKVLSVQRKCFHSMTLPSISPKDTNQYVSKIISASWAVGAVACVLAVGSLILDESSLLLL